jgi:type III restriction enzyme
VPVEDFNETEKTVALYLEDQDRLFCWYRNRPKQDYGIQGWRKNVIYPDFIFTKSKKGSKESFNKVYVVETKGIHLKNEDTDYKKAVFNLCNQEAKEIDWDTLGKVFNDKELQFEVVYEDEWQNKFNEYFVK